MMSQIEKTAHARHACGRAQTSWKQRVGEILSPALRLHHYRAAHNRLLHSALCEVDFPNSDSCDG